MKIDKTVMHPQFKPPPVTLPYAKMLVYAGVMVALLYSSGLTRVAAHGISTFVHEIGHTATAWLLGYPAIPMFGSMGGFTMSMGRSVVLMVILLAVYVFCFYRWFKLQGEAQGKDEILGEGRSGRGRDARDVQDVQNTRGARSVRNVGNVRKVSKGHGKVHKVSLKGLACWVVFFMVFFSPRWSAGAISLMGSGGEVIGGFLCGYVAWNVYRPGRLFMGYRYLLVALCVLLHVGVYAFAYKLCFDAQYMDLYLNPFSGNANDLLQNQVSLGISIKTQAVFLALMATASLALLWKTRGSPHHIKGEVLGYVKRLFILKPRAKDVRE